MALNDFVRYTDGGSGYPGDEVYAVAAQSTLTTTFVPGEPVAKALGAAAVSTFTASATSQPVINGTSTTFMAGIATGYSTETSALAGTVTVCKMSPSDTWLITPAVPATFGVGATPVQATYDALVGDRVLLTSTAVTTGVVTYTLLASDSANNGLIIMPLDVTKYPGKVRVALHNGLNYLSVQTATS